MQKEKWVEIDFEGCPSCGGVCKALTKSNKEGWFYDGDIVECENEHDGCEAKNLQISVDEEHAYITGDW